MKAIVPRITLRRRISGQILVWQLQWHEFKRRGRPPEPRPPAAPITQEESDQQVATFLRSLRENSLKDTPTR
jgi:hypothetical protein